MATKNLRNVELLVFPNSTENKVFVNSRGKLISPISLFSTTNQLISTQKINSENAEIDLTEFPNGTYILQIHSKNDVLTKRILKK